MAACSDAQVGAFAAELASVRIGDGAESRSVTAERAVTSAFRRLGRALLPVLAVSLVLAGCNGSEGTEPDESSDAPSVSETTETTANAEELAAQEATGAVAAMVEVLDAARRDPAGKDWEPEIRLVAADPFAAAAVDDVRTYATGGIRQVGDSVVEGEVTDVDLAAPAGPTVQVVACYDRTGSDVVRVDNGESILPPGELPRFVWNLTVIQYTSGAGSPWLVSVLEPQPGQPC